MFSPIPDANYTLEHIYAKYPTSIVTAGGTYLGDNLYNIPYSFESFKSIIDNYFISNIDRYFWNF